MEYMRKILTAVWDFLAAWGEFKAQQHLRGTRNSL